MAHRLGHPAAYPGADDDDIGLRAALEPAPGAVLLRFGHASAAVTAGEPRAERENGEQAESIVTETDGEYSFTALAAGALPEEAFLADLAGPGGIARAVKACRTAYPHLEVEVEADSLAQVEAALYQHPLVEEACVVGVPDPSQVERVKAFVVLKGGSPANADTERALIEHCRERLIKWSCPREVEFRRELPKTLDSFKPEVLFYVAGADALEGDQLGHTRVSATGLVKRDVFVIIGDGTYLMMSSELVTAVQEGVKALRGILKF